MSAPAASGAGAGASDNAGAKTGPILGKPPGEARTLREMFEYSVTRYAANVAFRRKTAKGYVNWTYTDVFDYVKRFSRSLLALGVKKGDRIAILSDNRPEWGVAFFSIISVGAIAVPLDRMLDKESIARLLAHSGARFVGAAESFTPALLEIFDQAPALENIFSLEEPKTAGKVVGYEDLMALGQREERDYTSVSVEPDDVLTIVYTSGTTGDPKGVMITHGNIAFEAWSLYQVNPYHQDDRLLSLLPMNHLYEFLAGFLGAFTCGGQTVYIGSLLPSRIVEALQECGITRVVGVPLLYTLFYEEVAGQVEKLSQVQKFLFFRSMDAARALRLSTGRSPGRLLFRKIHEAFGGKLRQAIVGGARMDPDIAERILDAGFPLYVGYGLTETSPVCTLGMLGKIPKGSVGKAIPGVTLKIDNPGPDGVGQIVVEGPNVMKGYFRDPDRTHEVLHGGCFYTGDLGYIDPDGYLFLTGRIKEMIVTHGGKKLFPEDLERQYAGIPYVKELCILGQSTLDGRGEEPVAVVVADREDPEAPRDPAELEQKIRNGFAKRTRQIPAYQAVKNLLFLTDPLPKTTTLKMRRLELAKMIQDRVGLAARLERRRKGRPEVSVVKSRRLDTFAVWHFLQAEEATQPRSMEQVRDALDHSTVVVSVWAQGHLVGFARAISDGALLATITDLVVARPWRRKGLGSLLLSRLLSDTHLKPVPRILVATEGPAEFLSRFGFQPSGSVFVRP